METMLSLKFVLAVIIAFHCCVQALGVDPCFEVEDGNLGSIGSCIPRSVCNSNVSRSGLCPSFPDDYTCCFSDAFPGRESRGAWIATVTNIDWPKSPADSVAVQQEALERLIDTLSDAGINAVYFQVRPAGDALYKSNIEPWSRYLTGKQGQAPNPLWDPFQYVIDYCHAKNIEVHAWINPYRASMAASTEGLASNHMALLYPQYAYPFSTYLWMDPGAEVVQNRTFDVVMDLTERYDIDGIHMDDYFYPYPVTGVPFPDNATYADYVRNNGGLSLEDWRRDNVNKLVKRLYDGVHEVKRWVRFSISPFGIYKPCAEGGMPCSINGFDQFSGLYCDPKLWLQEGWVDILQPQLYWKIDPPAQSYPVLLNWWLEQNPHNRHIYAGNYLSRIMDGWPLSELTNQVTISRETRHRMRGSWGNVQFSAKIFTNNEQGSVNFFKNTVYQYQALPPQYPWLVGTEKKPHLPSISLTNDGFVYLQMNQVARQGEGKVHKIITYRNNEGSWTVHKVIRLPHVLDDLHMEFRLEPGYYAFVAEDRYGQESEKQFMRIV
ncbi:unnamed protein product [Allacma fusca]|uniref:Glycosyl hydrolase-like 10 domain-containing protein n=1 Tax=Allacma fusca TaxID=39272 RepID=A0A8J2JCA6_9HEXA|nr:unnamed protein product [Allacma fusca]